MSFFMLRKALFIPVIIFANLFAFLTVWHILDSLLNYGVVMKIIFIILSIIPLILFLFIYIRKAQEEFNKIDISKDN